MQIPIEFRPAIKAKKYCKINFCYTQIWTNTIYISCERCGTTNETRSNKLKISYNSIKSTKNLSTNCKINNIKFIKSW